MTVFWSNIWLNDQIQGGANAPPCAPLRTPHEQPEESDVFKIKDDDDD